MGSGPGGRRVWPPHLPCLLLTVAPGLPPARRPHRIIPEDGNSVPPAPCCGSDAAETRRGPPGTGPVHSAVWRCPGDPMGTRQPSRGPLAPNCRRERVLRPTVEFGGSQGVQMHSGRGRGRRESGDPARTLPPHPGSAPGADGVPGVSEPPPPLSGGMCHPRTLCYTAGPQRHPPHNNPLPVPRRHGHSHPPPGAGCRRRGRLRRGRDGGNPTSLAGLPVTPPHLPLAARQQDTEGSAEPVPGGRDTHLVCRVIGQH